MQNFLNAKDRLSYLAIRAAVRMLAGMPRPVRETAALALGTIWYSLDRGHRRIALDNLRMAYGAEMDRDERRRLARRTFIHLARVVLELPLLTRLDRSNLHRYVTVSGEEHFKKALARNRGILFLTAHLGNWEMMAVAGALIFDVPFYIMVRHLDSAAADRVLTEIRTRTGNILLSKNHAAGAVRRILRNNRAIGILLDQNASWYDGVYVPFFGRTACTSKGLAMFALRYDATVLPIFSIRRDDGRYHIRVEPPVEPVRTGDVSRDIAETTRRYNRIIERHVRMAPDTWLWIHRRWRLKKIPERARRKLRLPGDLHL